MFKLILRMAWKNAFARASRTVSLVMMLSIQGLYDGMAIKDELQSMQSVEAIFVGILGFISGAILGLLLLIYLRDYGLDFSTFADALEMWGYETIIYGTIKLSYFTNTFVAIMSASVLSVLIPLRKIKKLNPIDVIKADK